MQAAPNAVVDLGTARMLDEAGLPNLSASIMDNVYDPDRLAEASALFADLAAARS